MRARWTASFTHCGVTMSRIAIVHLARHLCTPPLCACVSVLTCAGQHLSQPESCAPSYRGVRLCPHLCNTPQTTGLRQPRYTPSYDHFDQAAPTFPIWEFKKQQQEVWYQSQLSLCQLPLERRLFSPCSAHLCHENYAVDSFELFARVYCASGVWSMQ